MEEAQKSVDFAKVIEAAVKIVMDFPYNTLTTWNLCFVDLERMVAIQLLHDIFRLNSSFQDRGNLATFGWRTAHSIMNVIDEASKDPEIRKYLALEVSKKLLESSYRQISEDFYAIVAEK